MELLWELTLNLSGSRTLANQNISVDENTHSFRFRINFHFCSNKGQLQVQVAVDQKSPENRLINE